MIFLWFLGTENNPQFFQNKFDDKMEEWMQDGKLSRIRPEDSSSPVLCFTVWTAEQKPATLVWLEASVVSPGHLTLSLPGPGTQSSSLLPMSSSGSPPGFNYGIVSSSQNPLFPPHTLAWGLAHGNHHNFIFLKAMDWWRVCKSCQLERNWWVGVYSESSSSV